MHHPSPYVPYMCNSTFMLWAGRTGMHGRPITSTLRVVLHGRDFEFVFFSSVNILNFGRFYIIQIRVYIIQIRVSHEYLNNLKTSGIIRFFFSLNLCQYSSLHLKFLSSCDIIF